MVKDICNHHSIDVIHQITPIEFRCIGRYWENRGTKFIVGHLGGAEMIPHGLQFYARKKSAIEISRLILNRIARYKLIITGALGRCDEVLFANRKTRDYLDPNGVYSIMPEIGISGGY